MTLFEYLASLRPDYTNPSLGMIVTKGEVTDSHFEASRGRPFIQVSEGSIRVRKRFQQGMVFSKMVFVRIFHGANSDGTTPSYDKITDVWNQVVLAPSSVNDNSYEDNLISVRCIGGMSPHRDVNSGGVAAEVTFLVEFGREL